MDFQNFTQLWGWSSFRVRKPDPLSDKAQFLELSIFKTFLSRKQLSVSHLRHDFLIRLLFVTSSWRYNAVWFDSFTFIKKSNLPIWKIFENWRQEHVRQQTCSVSDSSRLRKFVIEHVNYKVILNVYQVKQPSSIFNTLVQKMVFV